MLQSEPLYEFIDRLKNLYRTPYQIANQTKFEIQIFQQQILSNKEDSHSLPLNRANNYDSINGRGELELD
uniref:Uncharacterized protein n=1 Tax=Panagrolaimus sp. ES5 TaxID=591445 RepID=A0AC34FAC8_9BILA